MIDVAKTLKLLADTGPKAGFELKADPTLIRNIIKRGAICSSGNDYSSLRFDLKIFWITQKGREWLTRHLGEETPQ